MLDDTNTVVPTSDAASGVVCNGWNTPVVDLINLGLQADVLRRLNAASPAGRTVYVVGHSRGATLVRVPARTGCETTPQQPVGDSPYWLLQRWQEGTCCPLLNANTTPSTEHGVLPCYMLAFVQASVFAAKLLALQASGGLPAYSGDKADQIKLYTFGSPRVGDTYFAAYLENNMRERYR